MGSQMPTKDLPVDWFCRFGSEIIDAYCQMSRTIVVKLKSSSISNYEPFYELKSRDRCPPIKSFCALDFYNSPAICYVLATPYYQEIRAMIGGEMKRTVFPSPWYIWFREAHKQWVQSTEEHVAGDGKDAFAPVYLRQERFSSFWDWVGLGVKSELEPEEAMEAKERDLGTLIAQHRHLCNLAHKRRERPCDFKDERMRDDHIWNQCRAQHPVISPICRAVLLIAMSWMTDERRILIALTGDNAALMGSAPTFDSIPPDEIFRHVGDNVVEVQLKTAVNYLRHLDNEEEKANDVLRSATETRKQKVETMIRENAIKEVTEFNEYCRGKIWLDECDLDCVTGAVWQVLNRHGALD
ncbi:hypothetical protein PRZ48_003330 [Zasmidium cellare]|uniref:Uncharacterized protein n=1 Tax=Zasmidium cellare TaxID=395010 RepID=A0ABR0EUR5_ZASCE|nr:hypothetical protein PRZ48_003330 [Zasmidium cellare]